MNGVADFLAQRLVDKKTEVHCTHVHRTVTQQYGTYRKYSVYTVRAFSWTCWDREPPGIRNQVKSAFDEST